MNKNDTIQLNEKYIALLSDVHFGEQQNNPKFLERQINWFANELLPELYNRNIKTLFILGDLFHNKEYTNKLIGQRVFELFKDVFSNINVYIIIGNHDLYYRDDLTVHSLHVLKNIPNVHILEDIMEIKIGKYKYVLTSWLIQNKKEEMLTRISQLNPDVIFGHFELSGFSYNRLYISKHGDDANHYIELFPNVKKIYSGHYHTQSKQRIKNIDFQYLGAPFQYTRIDANDTKGWWVLNTETLEDEFVQSKDIIKFISINYPNDLLENELKNQVCGNIIDIIVSTDKFLSKEFNKFIDLVNSYNPYRCETKLIGDEVNVKQEIKKRERDENEDASNRNVLDLIFDYIDTLNLSKDIEIPLKKEMTMLYNEAESYDLS